jgi:hypothetical protein
MWQPVAAAATGGKTIGELKKITGKGKGSLKFDKF